MKKLWHFELALLYGQCEGVFAATDEEVQALYGTYIYFGEIEGKHSEIDAELEEDMFEVISEDPAIVENPNFYWGYNPVKILADYKANGNQW